MSKKLNEQGLSHLLSRLKSMFAAKKHSHTKSEVGLSKVDNTSDAEKSVKYAATAMLDSSGQQINGTYVKSVSIDDNVITLTKGNGTKETIYKTNSVNSQEFGLAWIYWTNNLVTGDGLENDAITYANHDIIATQCLSLNELASSKPTLTSDSVLILKRAKELNPKLRYFEYIQSDSGRTDFSYNGDHAHLNSDGSWEGSTADLSGSSRIYTFEQFCDWFDWFKKQGADGIFFDDWGYDFAKEDICYQFGWDPDNYENLNAAKNEKWKKLIDACHERGLSVITNGGTPFDVGDWYTHLNENDIIAMESCMISSAGNTWSNGQKSLYNYYANWYSTGKCKAKIWSLDYIPTGSKEFRNQVLTYLCAMGLACGANYISMGVAGRIEKPLFVEIFTRGTQKKIVKMDDNTYLLSVGRHQLEVHRWSSLSGEVTEKNVAKNYYILDGRSFNNAFSEAPIIEKEMSDRMAKVESTVDGMTEDTRQNAPSYWRMTIDDWQADLSYLDYRNILTVNEAKVANLSSAIAAFEKNDDETVDLVVKYNNHTQGNVCFTIITSSNYEDLKLTNTSLEIGYSEVVWDMEEGSWTLPQGTPYYGASDWATPSFRMWTQIVDIAGNGKGTGWIKGEGSNVGETTGYFAQTEGEIVDYKIYIWMKVPDNMYATGTITFKNIYLIDLGEHADEVTKKWYTNIFPNPLHYPTNFPVTQTKKTKQGKLVFDLNVTSGNAWGSAVSDFSADDVIALRGHKIELGCSSMTFSNGYTGHPLSDQGNANYAFGIGVNNTAPTTYRLFSDTSVDSSVWDEKLICVIITVPNDATSLCVGFRSYGYPADIVCSVKEAYLYDLDEEVAIRGKVKTNASLRVCRVNEAEEEEAPLKLEIHYTLPKKGECIRMTLKETKSILPEACMPEQ